ncbi:hypothetical protein, partial [Vibrio cholerae]|uniref:hypothetical protein n=1 Tax=Vibrio cholerae TaxID=666 RepID=UPI001F4637C0
LSLKFVFSTFNISGAKYPLPSSPYKGEERKTICSFVEVVYFPRLTYLARNTPSRPPPIRGRSVKHLSFVEVFIFHV